MSSNGYSLSDDAIVYDTLERFEPVDGLQLVLIKAQGAEDGFLYGPPCLHLVLNAPDGAYERVFSFNADSEDLAKGQGMTLALSIAKAEWENPAPATPIQSLSSSRYTVDHLPGGCVIIGLPGGQVAWRAAHKLQKEANHAR